MTIFRVNEPLVLFLAIPAVSTIRRQTLKNAYKEDHRMPTAESNSSLRLFFYLTYTHTTVILDILKYDKQGW